MFEQLDARIVDCWNGGIVFEASLARQLAGEVFVGIQELEEAADGIDIFVWEVDLSRLEDFLLALSITAHDGSGKPYYALILGKSLADAFKIRASHEEFLMRL